MPESNGNLPNFTTEPGPQPWVMFPETTYQHLMVLAPPPVDAIPAAEDEIANARSGGPGPIAEGARSWAIRRNGRNWPDEVAPALIELLPGDNGWTCIADIPDTPGNDPMCLNDTYFEVLMAQRAT
ncbi:MAG: hypothetical protein R3A10_02140 [Caldilineaceae bacterium]